MTESTFNYVLGFFAVGFQELLIILILLGLAIVVIAVVYFIIKANSKPPPQLPPKMGTREERLKELESLRSKSLITEEEHQARRQKIVDEI